MAVKRTGPGFATLNAALKGLDGVEGKSGWFESARYQDANATPVAYVAAIQEFGDGPIPPRPFMRPTVAHKGPAWMELMGKGATAALAGQVEPVAVMEAVAMRAAADVAVTISEVFSPPLSPLTLLLRKWKREHPGEEVTGTIVGEMAEQLRKGPPNVAGISTKPLVDSGRMIQDVTGVVERTKT